MVLIRLVGGWLVASGLLTPQNPLAVN